jgi:hypothetical protein
VKWPIVKKAKVPPQVVPVNYHAGMWFIREPRMIRRSGCRSAPPIVAMHPAVAEAVL